MACRAQEEAAERNQIVDRYPRAQVHTSGRDRDHEQRDDGNEDARKPVDEQTVIEHATNHQEYCAENNRVQPEIQAARQPLRVQKRLRKKSQEQV